MAVNLFHRRKFTTLRSIFLSLNYLNLLNFCFDFNTVSLRDSFFCFFGKSFIVQPLQDLKSGPFFFEVQFQLSVLIDEGIVLKTKVIVCLVKFRQLQPALLYRKLTVLLFFGRLLNDLFQMNDFLFQSNNLLFVDLQQLMVIDYFV